jgi:hypothetical protein
MCVVARPVSWLATALVGLTALLGVTLYALESNEVVVLRTFDSAGGVHEARVWIVDDLGYSWIEAASPTKLFYRRLLDNPDIEVVRDGRTHRHRAVPVTTPRAHARLRELLAEKYGLADRWVGLFVDSSASIAVRVEPRMLGQVSR